MKQKQMHLFLILILLFSILVTLTGCKNNNLNQENNVIVESDDGKFQINIPEDMAIEFNNDENYSLDLFCEEDNMYLYSTTIYKTREVDLLDYVNDDKEYVISSKENSRDISEITSMQIQDYTSYTYNFTYTDSEFGKDFYTQIIWIETSENIYILNFEVVTENKEAYLQIFNDIANSFVEL